jgi:hypothetical protein
MMTDMICFDSWTENTAIVLALARRRIFLAKSTWPGAAQLPHGGPADPQFGFHWRSNFQ